MTQGPATAAPAAPLNGAPQAPAPGGGNRKKQKRREKEAAKRNAEAQRQNQNQAAQHSQRSAVPSPAPAQAPPPPPGPPASQYHASEAEDHYDEEGEFYSEDDDEHYDQDYHPASNGRPASGYIGSPPPHASKKHKKKKRGSAAAQQSPYPSLLSRPSASSHSTSKLGKGSDGIWNTSTNEERNRIREFWLSLGEEERKGLVKIEKEAVLRKMKEQQKHSCSCTVCGRKRTAIEEELEVLYDAYYEELEQYANIQQDGHPALHSVLRYPPPRGSAHHHRLMTNHHQIAEYEEEYDSEEEHEDYDDDGSEISSDGEYSSEDRGSLPPDRADFLQFGSSLQVKGTGL